MFNSFTFGNGLRNGIAKLFTILVATAIIFSLVTPIPVQAAGVDVSAQIVVTKLVLRKTDASGEILYDSSASPSTPPNAATIKLAKGQSIYYEVEWETVGGASGTNFNDGDWFEIPIVATADVSHSLPPSVTLIDPSTLTPLGTGSFLVHAGVSLGGETVDQLVFKVVFNANAETNRVIDGTVNGLGSLTSSGGKIINGAETVFTQYGEVEDGGGGDDGGDPPPTLGSFPGIWVANGGKKHDDEFFDFKKSVVSGSIRNGLLDHRDSNNNGGLYPALPDRNGESYPSFIWRAAFLNLQEEYEADPSKGATSGYIIFEDTIGSNLAFSNYDAPITPYGNPGATYPEELRKDAVYKNDFFAFEVPFKIFGLDEYIHPLLGQYTSRIFLYQSELLHFVEADADAIYSSDYELLSNTAFTSLEEAVLATPLSYAIIPLASGETKLIINAGKFGNAASTTPGESIPLGGLSQTFYGGSIATTIVGAYYGMITNTITSAERYLNITTGTDTPYTAVLGMLTELEVCLSKYSSVTGYTAAITDFNNLKKYLLGPDGVVGGGDGGALKEGYIPPQGATSSELYGDIWLDADLIYRTATNTTYANLFAFINTVTFNHNVQWNTVTPDPTNGIFGTGDEAAYIAASRLKRMAELFDSELLYYGQNMNMLFNKVGDSGEVALNSLVRSRAYFTTALFHYPGLKDVISSTLITAGLIPDVPYATADSLLDAILANPTDLPAIKAIINNGTLYHPLLDAMKASETGFNVSSLVLHYKTILVDTNIANMNNNLVVKMTGATEEELGNTDKEYIYAYSATIRAIRNGGVGFIKAKAPDNYTVLWDTTDLANFVKATGLSGAGFQIFASLSDAQTDTNPLTFVSKSAAIDTYVLDASGSISTIVTTASGKFIIEGLNDSLKYYIKEVTAPVGFELNQEIYEFRVAPTASETTPLLYVGYNVATIDLKTSARDGSGSDANDRNIVVDGVVTIIDTVSYTGLTPGKEYVLKGTLYDKVTQLPLTINGVEVTGTTTFTATSETGTEEVVFTFNSSALGEKVIVVFEELYLDGTLIAEHKDIDDIDQTVTLTKGKKDTPDTGVANNTITMLVLVMSASAVVVGLKAKKKED